MSKAYNLNKIFIWYVVIIASNLFGFYNVIAKYTHIYFSLAISFLLSIVSLIMIGIRKKRFGMRVSLKRCINRYAALFLFWVMVELAISYIRYSDSQSLVSTAKESLFCFAPIFIYYAFSYTITDEKDFDYLVDVLINVSVVCSILAIVALAVYSQYGNNFLGLDIDNYSFIRNNRGHFMVGSMVVIPATVFLWVRIIKGAHGFTNCVYMVLNLIHVVYIGQTRMLIAIMLIVIVLSYLVVSKRSITVKVLLLIALIVSVTMSEYQAIREKIFASLLDNSVSYRLAGIQFYFAQILKNPILGMGFIDSTNSALKPLLYGPLHRFYRTDVGFIGFVDCLGILAGIWFISLLVYSIKMTFKTKAKIDVRFYEYCLSYSLLIVLCSISLFPIDGYRILMLPIYMIMMRLLEKKNLILNVKHRSV